MPEDSFKDDLIVDKYNLHLEWEKQPSLYMKWAELHANALQDQDRAKEQLDLVRANVDSKIRKNPDEYGLEKVTESAISACIPKQEEYQVAQSALIEAKRNVAVLAGAKEAMAHKKKAIEMLTQLVIFGYYSDPKIPKDFVDKMGDKRRREINEDLNKNKRMDRLKRRKRKE